MNITNLFGEYLAELTGKRPIACKGIIRLAVKDAHQDRAPENLDYSELKDVFNTTFKQRLENVGIPNIDQIVQSIMGYLVKNQSLLTMA
jgi:hypothetical protein